MIHPSTNQQDVKECAQHLDLIYKDWASKIDVAYLDLWDYHNCILGQLFGEYGRGADVLKSHMGRRWHDLSFAFMSNSNLDWWIEEINHRLRIREAMEEMQMLERKSTLQKSWSRFRRFIRG